MDPRRKKWIAKIIRERLVFILVLIITSLISIITLSILKLDFTSIIVYIIAFLLGLIILLFILYIHDFIERLDDLCLDECIAHDITILNFEKNLFFDENSRSNGTDFEEIRVIRNNMRNAYNLYQFTNQTEVDAPPFEKLEFYKDGERKNYSSDDVKFHSYNETDFEDNLHHKIIFKFPVHAPIHETREIKVKFPIKSFDSALDGQPDWTQVTINAVTERLRISVTLRGELKRTHQIVPPLPPNSSGEEQDIEVRDFSDERMWSSELYYRNERIKPKWNGDTMEWVVYRPIIGYKYRVYFTIKPKEI